MPGAHLGIVVHQRGVDPAAFDRVFADLTTQSELVSLESIRGGALTELMWTVKLRKNVTPAALVAALQARANGQKVTVLTGYDRTDL